jgi:hypothetical protein
VSCIWREHALLSSSRRNTPTRPSVNKGDSLSSTAIPGVSLTSVELVGRQVGGACHGKQGHHISAYIALLSSTTGHTHTRGPKACRRENTT